MANVGTVADNTTQVTVADGTVGTVYGGGLGRIKTDAVNYTQDEADAYNTANNLNSGDSGFVTTETVKTPGVSAVAALVNGAVTVTVNGGTVTNVFGCNNQNGSPQSTVQVDINSSVSGSVYGGGNLASYTAPEATTTNTTAHDYPVVNILAGTVSGDVFGGGLGDANDATKGVVTGNPQVTINGSTAEVTGGVYGGGSLAPTTGNPVVALTDGSTTKIFGGGKAANINGATAVTINGGTVSTGVYGGCDSEGTVNNNTSVTLSGGTIGTSSAVAEVCGGGLGKDTKVTNGTSYVFVGTGTVGDATTFAGTTTLYGDIYGGSAFGEVNNTEVNLFKLAGTSFGYNVFGGGKGKFIAANDEGNIEAKVNGTATVNMYALTITGTDDAAAVYGGCNVNGTTATAIVNLIGGTIGSSGTEAHKVFGGGKGNATTTNNATVYVGTSTSVGSSSIYSNVYGGSALGAVGNATVNLNKATTLAGDVFGGGMGRYTAGANDNAQAMVTGTATVNLSDGFDVTGNIYGGCNIYGETANAEVNLIGGTVGTASSNSNVFGGGKGPKTTFTTYNSETGKGTITVNLGTKSDDTTPVYGGTTHVYGKIYGGSEEGSRWERFQTWRNRL